VLDAPHGLQHVADAKERAALAKWLAGKRINEEYDSLDAGELAPAEILARRCVSCHARQPKDAAGANGVGATLPLEFWDDVAKVAFEKKLDPCRSRSSPCRRTCTRSRCRSSRSWSARSRSRRAGRDGRCASS
jgi:hypothetical protein